jgi:hypothetical protein
MLEDAELFVGPDVGRFELPLGSDAIDALLQAKRGSAGPR